MTRGKKRTSNLAAMSSTKEPKYIPLWADRPPDAAAIRHVAPEQTVNRDIDRNAEGLNRAISNVDNPGVWIYPVTEGDATGDVVLVCPGGGYSHVTVDKEGHDVARWLNTIPHH